jgi:hypothetical protein
LERPCTGGCVTSDPIEESSVNVSDELTGPETPELAYAPPSIFTLEDGAALDRSSTPVEAHTHLRPPAMWNTASNPSSREPARASTRTFKAGSVTDGAVSSTAVARGFCGAWYAHTEPQEAGKL